MGETILRRGLWRAVAVSWRRPCSLALARPCTRAPRVPRLKSLPARRRAPSNRRLRQAAPARRGKPPPRLPPARRAPSGLRPKRRGRFAESPAVAPQRRRPDRPSETPRPRRARPSPPTPRRPAGSQARETAAPALRRASSSLSARRRRDVRHAAPRQLKAGVDPIRSWPRSRQAEGSGDAQGRGLRRPRRAASLLCRAHGAPLWVTRHGLLPRGRRPSSPRSRRPMIGVSRPKPSTCRPRPDLPANTEAQASDEVKLDLAVLKYARYARGGRLSPGRISMLLDQKPELRKPKTVLTEIAAAPAPAAYLALAASEARAVRAACAKLLLKSRRAKGKKQAIGEPESSASSSTWSAGGGCPPISALTTSGTTSPSSSAG